MMSLEEKIVSYVHEKEKNRPPFESLIQGLDDIFKEYGYRENPAKAIALIATNGMGDAIMMTGFIRELRRCFPDYTIVCFSGRSEYEILKNCPYLDRVIKLAYRTETVNILNIVDEPEYIREAWKYHFEYMVHPFAGYNNTFGNMFGFLTGAKKRIGFNRQSWRQFVGDCREIFEWGEDMAVDTDAVLLTDSAPFPYSPCSDVDKFYMLLEHIGFTVEDKKLKAWIDDESRKRVEKYTKKKYIVISPADFSRFLNQATKHEILVGVSARITDDPVYADITRTGDELTINGFSYEKKSSYEWANVVYMPANLMKDGTCNAFEYIQTLLPAPAATLDRLEIDTKADLEYAKKELSKGNIL